MQKVADIYRYLTILIMIWGMSSIFYHKYEVVTNKIWDQMPNIQANRRKIEKKTACFYD